MRFTRLRLSGFKSFVDPTELQIRDGLTGVVGPNGCGKSNLLEALRWVMGENRPSAMRGGGMEDVIFNGSGRRPARAHAEVALGLDNSARTAPAGFNDSDALEISRKLTRDLGSSYRISGREVRARDVQMLFADASTGAHSPGLVRQGQISELINAKPRARRRVLEEAAGIAGLYQRRHEAELKLNATEANLARVADTLEQLEQQLAVLRRQAKQAERYREVAGQLRRAEGFLLLGRWREAEATLGAAQARLGEALTEAGARTRAAEAAGAAREAAEMALPALRDEAAIAGAVVARCEAEAGVLAAEEARARAALADLAAQIARAEGDAAREAALVADAAGVLERLASEAGALAAAGEGEEARIEAARDEADAADAELQALDAGLSALTEEVAVLAARREAAEAVLSRARAEAARAEAALARAAQEHTAREAALALAEAAAEGAEAEAEAALAVAEEAEAAFAGAEAARGEAQSAEGEARASASAARGEAQALASEVAGIERALSRSGPEGDGVLAVISVAPGYERALGAALGEDLRLPLSEAGSGWRRLSGLEAAPAWPFGAAPLAPLVTAPEELARRLAFVGVVEGEVSPAMQAALVPGQRLVSRAGDLWRWDGVALAAGQAPSAAALRLEQVNRLAALREALAEAEARRDEAARAHEAEAARLARLTEAERIGREARRLAERRAGEAGEASRRAAGAVELARGRLQASEMERARAGEEREAAAARLAEAEARQDEGEGVEAARARLAAAREAVEAARARLGLRRGLVRDLEGEARAREKRQGEVGRELSAWAERRDRAGGRISELETRAAELAESRAEAEAVPMAVAEKRLALSDTLATARVRLNAANEAMAQGEAELAQAAGAEREAERAAGLAREARAAAEARTEAARAAFEEAEARILDERGQTAAELIEACGPGEAPALAELEAEVARLRRAREGLGAVNLRAEEDARLLQAENDTLVAERADLDAAVAKLRGGIGALNREGRERLLAAFEQINATFAQLFTHLFGGGEARLVLVESDDPLEAGLEILCQPPGKKLSSLSLLSGGEQTLTALALIFGVFLTNPAPICVLDEVDAPLDDANVARFCDLLDEMTRRTETRFLIITHNPITMARMDRLYGVTMVEQGVSQLVSVDLRRAEALVA